MDEQEITGKLNLDLEKSFGPLDECVVITGQDRRILFVNRAAEEVFGYTRQDLIGATAVNLYANPEEFTAISRIYDDSAALSVENRFTLPLRRKNGSIFTAEVVSAALYCDTSDPVGFLFIARDVSDRVVLETRLNETLATFEDALETISEGFALYDKDDRLVICNEKYREIYAHSAPAIVPGTTFKEIIEYGLDRNEYDLGSLSREEWLKLRMDRHLAADGEVIEQALGDGSWLQIAERITKSGGRAGIRADITDLKAAQSLVEEALHDLSSLADNLSCSITEYDLEGKCIFLNETSATWFGGRKEELLGARLRDRLPAANRAKSDPLFKRALAGEKISFETRNDFIDGQTRDIRIDYIPKKNAAGDFASLVVLATDITDIKQAQAQAEKAHRDLSDLTDNLSCAIIEMDLDGYCIFANKVFANWFGKSCEDMLGIKIRDMLPPESRKKSEPYYRRALKGEHIYFEDRVLYPGGIEREVSIEYTPKLNASGERVGIIIYSTDITERKQTERTLAKLYSITSTRELTTDQKINQILKLGCEHFGLPFGIISRIIEGHYSIIYADSPNGEVQVGASFNLGETYCAHTLKADKPVTIAHTKQSALAHHPCYEKFRLEAYIGAPLLVDGERYGTINFTDSNRRERPFSQTERELIRQFADWIGHEIAREQDHIALMEAQIRLERIASIDDLTGVLNRRAFMKRAMTEIARYRRTGRKFTAVMIDIDHFKSINDTFGHSAGDEVLKKFAAIISDALRAVDVFGRVGGEEFCIILDSTEKDDAMTVCERIRQRVIEECRVDPITWDITCSMGLATVAKEDVEFSTLMQLADHALYRAKESGRNRCRFYKTEDYEHVQAH
ncbi:diguanylate cyclase [uncultured Roseibium sp.]|uniref:sensor domain-containing diguanylate cyclase n=1 Tax=uncultured Roseibium sp. TaxID=1936171 RepID=UPI003217CB4F